MLYISGRLHTDIKSDVSSLAEDVTLSPLLRAISVVFCLDLLAWFDGTSYCIMKVVELLFYCCISLVRM